MTSDKSVCKYSEEDKLKAAYALNLCTVSVSQIIEYNDLNILEQEYEMILNNLNLENIPKDEALLNILKQLLDTITFFRIQEGDKKFVDMEYQHKISSAIWSAVPNFGVILAGGSPLSIATALASQVGIGYMNYRRNKAEIKLAYERSYWQLQRTAMEQLNGLRRELFDTAWRLSAEYDFPDEYRLTENQIKQYNAILLDPDPVRKYERLDSVKNKFKAYVPFWYHFGSTANQIAQNLRFSKNVRETYSFYAAEHFKMFHKLNDKKLLREDQIAAACALEYIDLLDVNKDKIQILELIESAVQMSGDACDILELCAIAYLKVKEMDKACALLRQLVNENYNAILNAQILSNIYVSNFVYKIKPDKAEIDYEVLESRVDKAYLFPMPEDGIYDVEKLRNEFYEKQRKVLKTKYRLVLKEFIQKYTVKYNKIFPTPNRTKIYKDSYYLDSDNARAKRLEELERVFSSNRKKAEYCEWLKDEMIVYDMFGVINEMYAGLAEMFIIKDLKSIKMKFMKGILKSKENIMGIMEALSENRYDNIDVEGISSFAYKDLIYEGIKDLSAQLMDYIEQCNDMNDFVHVNSVLRDFCISQSITDPDRLMSIGKKEKDETEAKQYFSPKLLGLDYTEIERINEVKDKMLEIFMEYKEQLPRSNRVMCMEAGTPAFENYFKIAKKEVIRQWRKNTVAVIDDRGVADMDLLLTDKGLIAANHNGLAVFVLYDEINYKDDGLVGEGCIMEQDLFKGLAVPVMSVVKKTFEWMNKTINFKYRNKNLDTQKLYSLIVNLGEEINARTDASEQRKKNREGAKDYYEFLEC